MRHARTLLLVLWPTVLASTVAGCLALGVIRQRRDRFTRNAEACDIEVAEAIRWIATTKWVYQSMPERQGTMRAMISQATRRRDHFRRWAGVWREAAEHPWRDATPL